MALDETEVWETKLNAMVVITKHLMGMKQNWWKRNDGRAKLFCEYFLMFLDPNENYNVHKIGQWNFEKNK